MPFILEKDIIKTKSNHCGGVLGGISTGMPILARATVKATSSTAINQESIDKNGNKVQLQIEGRHDPCIVPRIVPVVESMLSLVLCDHYLRQKVYR